MSIKRSSSGRQPTRGLGGEGSKTSIKVDRQALYDELQRRAEADQPFAPLDLAGSLGVTETVANRHLLLLSADGFVTRLEGGVYTASAMRDVALPQFLKELQAAARNPTREKDLQDIARLKSNNDIMRERLIAATAERDRYLALLQQHGIDPGEAPARDAAAAPSGTPSSVSAEAPTAPITKAAAPAEAAPAEATPAEAAPAATPPAPPSDPTTP